MDMNNGVNDAIRNELGAPKNDKGVRNLGDINTDNLDVTVRNRNSRVVQANLN
jgi:hypothetical protein